MYWARLGAWKLMRTTEDSARTDYWTAGLGYLGGDRDSTGRAPRTFLLFRLQTGWTHQLRVVAKSLGLSIPTGVAYRGKWRRRPAASTSKRRRYPLIWLQWEWHQEHGRNISWVAACRRSICTPPSVYVSANRSSKGIWHPPIPV